MKVIELPIFNMDINVFSCNESKDFEAQTELTITDEDGIQCGNYMWFSTNEDPLIVHECSHMVDWILEVRLDYKPESFLNSTEIRAYMLEWIYKEVKKCLEN